MNLKDKKSLVVYYSRKGNNYVNGNIINLKIGNTSVAANYIKEITEADLFEIEPVNDYPEDYNECTKVAQAELKNNERPRLTKYLDNIDSYEVIYIGYPNWWGTMPMPVYTLLESLDFSNKIIMPFCTNEGSGMGHSENDIKKICPNSNVMKGLAINGTSVKDSKSKIESWIEG
jgi:flavodoxin